MKVDGKEHISVLYNKVMNAVEVIDQRLLPFEFSIVTLYTSTEIIDSIKNMTVRGAPAIGILSAWGTFMAYKESSDFTEFMKKCSDLRSSRPTAINLSKGIDFVLSEIRHEKGKEDNIKEAFKAASNFSNSEIDACYKIGFNGYELINDLFKKKKNTINILTHCNAGWLACGDWGTALSPVFVAHRKGIPVHVWVDETRPRNQGSGLTAWELFNEGIPFTIIPDNSGGLLMQQNEVDIVITGADRIAANGDTANKTGTYLKALAASHNSIPFYIAAPVSTFDFRLEKGVGEIPIEIRPEKEISVIKGINENKLTEVRIFPENFRSLNHAFDITPSGLITGFITEKGILNYKEIKSLYE